MTTTPELDAAQHRIAELEGQVRAWMRRKANIQLSDENKRLRAALEKIAEGAHGVYLAAGVGTRVSHKTIESVAREALGHPKDG